MDYLQHLWDSGHVLLAHFPIALLTIAFVFAWVGYIGGLVNKHASNLPWIGRVEWAKAYNHVWILQVLGTITIFPTKLLGERDFDKISSQKLEDLAESHEKYGELTTYFYLLFLGFTITLMLYRKYQLSPKSAKNTVSQLISSVVAKIEKTSIAKLMQKLCIDKEPIQTFYWLVLATVGFVLLCITGYLGGELVHEHGLLAN